MASAEDIETEQPDRPRVSAAWTDTAPELDGRLEDLWQAGGYIPKLRQEVPVAYGEATQRTEVWMLYDADFLYIGVRAHDDEPDKIIKMQVAADADK